MFAASGDADAAALEEAFLEVVTGPPSFASCNGLSYDKSQQSCCGGTLYSLTSEGCCGNRSVYAFARQGCCNNDHVFTYGEEICSEASAPPGQNSEFSCAADWPPETYSNYWRRYCAAGHHMAWAMTESCKVGWLSVQQSSIEQAEAKALEACNKKAAAFDGETCKIFDRDGGECRRQRCGADIYDASVKACCGGRVIDRVAEGCCSGVAFKVQSQGCCQGRVYSKAGYPRCSMILERKDAAYKTALRLGFRGVGLSAVTSEALQERKELNAKKIKELKAWAIWAASARETPPWCTRTKLQLWRLQIAVSTGVASWSKLRRTARAARPRCVAFDLDGCLWHPAMAKLRGEGLALHVSWPGGGGAPFHRCADNSLRDRRGEHVQLYDGVLGALADIVPAGGRCHGALLAVASCCEESGWADACLKAFEFSDGRCLDDLVELKFYGRSRRKQDLLRRILRRVPCMASELLFFDNEPKHCSDAAELGATAVSRPSLRLGK
ncbi:MDP1 [Symbiodinium sp. KB8]|nr:MDP1 [Symbiodinium sp. KB8]